MISSTDMKKLIISSQMEAIDETYTKILRKEFRKPKKAKKKPRIIPASEIPRGYIY